MGAPETANAEPVHFETHPDRYRHWRVEYPADYAGAVARIVMDVEGGRRASAPATRSS